MKNVFKVLLSALMVVTLFVGCEDVLPTNDISAAKDVNLSKDLEFYAIQSVQMSSTLSSGSNKIQLRKVSRVDGITTSKVIQTFGTFVSAPNLYEVYYGSSSDIDAPIIGHDVYAYYKGTVFEGYSERYWYASLTLEDMMSKVQNDISNNIAVKQASNAAGADLTKRGNFWTYLQCKQGLYDRLAEISNQSKDTKSAVKDANISQDLEFYAIQTVQMSINISSGSNKVKLLKVSRVDGTTTSKVIQTFGTFVSAPNLYEVYYGSSSDIDAPKIGHDVYAYYKGTMFEGYSERYWYASLTLEDMMSKVQNDISNNIAVKQASNAAGADLTKRGNFWTYLQCKQGLYERLEEISNQ